MPGSKPGALPLGDIPTEIQFFLNILYLRQLIVLQLPIQKIWLGYQDSNLGMPGSKPGALPLGDIPFAVTSRSTSNGAGGET
ncbi:MAG: hypothetical protein RL248_174 [Pseudomonadota bacterium]